MKYKKTTLKIVSMMAILTLWIGFATAQSNIKTSIQDFPKAEQGFKQIVIEVPYSDNDASKKIEFFVGKMMDTDDCNQFYLSGEFEKKDLKGFGYTYYTFKSNGNVISTAMGCLSGKTIQQFVKSDAVLERYNGRMPIVVYVPEEYELKFKIWKASSETYTGAEILKTSK